MSYRLFWFCALFVVGFHVALPSIVVATAPSPSHAESYEAELNRYLSEGDFENGIRFFQAKLTENPRDEQARFALGFTELVVSMDGFTKQAYRYGLSSSFLSRNLPFFRLPIPANPNPEKLSYPAIRKIFEDLNSALDRAGKTLEPIESLDSTVHLSIGLIRLDIDGNKDRSPNETLAKLARIVSPNISTEMLEKLIIGVDIADVHWLKGYIHVLQGITDVILAYDHSELFHRCGHIFFAKIESPYLVPHMRKESRDAFDYDSITDIIAAIHLFRFPVKEKARLQSAHGHFLSMVRESRITWRHIESEKDDDHEWIPNPSQTGEIQVPVSRELAAGWQRVLDEVEALLNGKKLIPFWRLYSNRTTNGSWVTPNEGKGINLYKVFHDPIEFDLILFAQGTALEQYLDDGELSTPEAWSRLMEVFQGRFAGIAVWFN